MRAMAAPMTSWPTRARSESDWEKLAGAIDKRIAAAAKEAAKVRKGGVGGHVKELPPAIAAAMDAKWRAIVTPVTGHADYAALEADLRAGV